MALTPKDVDDLTESMKKLLELWMRIKLVLLKAFGAEPVTREHENAFMQLKSDVSRIYRATSNRLSSGLQFEGDKLVEMLKNAMTMAHLQKLSPNEKQSIYVVWHLLYIRMTRTLGALETMKAGYYPHMHRSRLQKMPVGKAAKS
ncbi:MAG: hypothetical protein M1457_11525 [bacterium]|nr:hypothetical protein [bacterium]